MENLMEFAGGAAMLLLSVLLAFGLAWLGLLGAFRLLPGSPRGTRAVAPRVCAAAQLQWAAARSKELPRVSRAAQQG